MNQPLSDFVESAVMVRWASYFKLWLYFPCGLNWQAMSVKHWGTYTACYKVLNKCTWLYVVDS